MFKKSKKNFTSAKPIDFVIIWVDGNDPEWRKEKAEYDPNVEGGSTANSEVRYRDWDNLQYWFRGVERYAPWVNKIHFVTWGHLPPWLDTTNPKLNIVKHSDFIPAEYLPTFSSHTIELNLHRIEGLAEQFVYFNDDMFLTKPVNAEDFFVNGVPCDTAALNCVYFNVDTAGHFYGADLAVINNNFKMKQSVKKNFRKWYNLKNGKNNLVKTAVLSLWPWFPGFFNQHAPNGFLKSTFSEIWTKEYDTLDATCRHKFRQVGDVNQWVVKFWQLAEGNFAVRKNDFAYCYNVRDDNIKALCSDIISKKRAMLCINDNSKTVDFDEKKQAVIQAFEQVLPERSKFEKE